LSLAFCGAATNLEAFMSSESTHEPWDLLSDDTKNLHRAIVSLVEELEAVDWYQQRASVCPDAELKAVLLHHRDEEIEHAMMNLEWIRRHDQVFDRNLRTYIYAEGPITQVEEAVTGGPADLGTIEGGPTAGPRPAATRGSFGSLGIGSLRKA
jgi:ferritin-like protein